MNEVRTNRVINYTNTINLEDYINEQEKLMKTRM